MGRRPDHIQGSVFERHRSRRVQGVPTLSVLSGEADAAEWCWSRWQRARTSAAEFARSRAERTLFDHLEGRTRTRGLFRLNGTIAEAFGGRPLEIDLLSEELRIALEIDGYHHFRDSAAYRRDRDKDVRLQRLGYTVVRVLATDVNVELDFVTDTIDRVVDHEKQKRAP